MLLSITGDSSDAQRELADISRDLAVFGRETAEAEADLDTTSASARLDELKAKLAAFSTEDASAEVNVQIAKAQADIAVLQAELDHIDGENVTVDVDVRRGIVERIASLTGQVERLGQGAEQTASGGVSQFIQSIGDAEAGVGRWSASLSSIAEIAPLVIAAVVAIVGQLAAIVASAGSAVAGIGALAVAFGAALVPGILLAVGAIARFKADAGTAGTAAHALSSAFSDFGEAFTKATGAGADAVFRGLSDALKTLTPLVENLKPAFTDLGKAGGDAFRLLAQEFSSPAWGKFFTFATESLTKLTPLFARSFGAFAAILRNIATAAMPFLIKGFQSLAEGIEGVAHKTSDIGSLRDSIGGMVDSLRAFGHLLGGVTDLVGAFVTAFAPFGDAIVESLGDGAHNLADWLRSSEGLSKIKQFFEDTGPLASELAKLFLNVSLALIQIAEFAAPALTSIVKGANEVVGIFNKVLSFLNDNVSPGFRAAAGSVAFLLIGFGKLKAGAEFVGGALRVLLGIAGGLGGAFKGALSAVASAASDLWDAAKSAIGKTIEFVLAVPRDVLSVIADIWKTAKNKVSDVINFVLKAPRTVLGVIQDIWSTAKGKIRQAINFLLKAPRTVLGVISDIWAAAHNKITQVINFLLKVPHDAVSAASDIWGEVHDKITQGINFVLGFASGIVDKARAIWDAVNNALPDITLNIDIPTPSIPHIPGLAGGVRDLPEDTLSMVGEKGPELRLLPKGTDIFTASETRRILRALADGVARPLAGGGAAIPALASGGGGPAIGEQSFHFHTPGTGSPDPRIAMAQAALIQRQQGRR